MERRDRLNIYLCEDSIEGIFSAIYMAWSEKRGHKNNRISIKKEGLEYELFAEYIEVENSIENMQKVASSIKKKISEEAYEWVCRCACSCSREKADDIYHFLILGFVYGKKVLECIHHPYVLPMFEMNRAIEREIEHYYGFLRFIQLDNMILYAKIAPENDIIALMAPHFLDRLSNESWMIYDVKRQKAAFHVAHESYFLADLKKEVLEKAEYTTKSVGEQEIQKLWKGFVTTVSIEERKNISLQQSMLPKKFRNYMVEFREEINRNPDNI